MALPHHGVNHYENFPVASVLCPPHLRAAVRALYGFARTADDLADEGSASADERLEALRQFRHDLLSCAAGRSTSGRWPGVFTALAPILESFKLPLPLLQDLLSAFEQDVVLHRYDTRSQLLDYCRRSANPVGRLMLHLYGIDDPPSLQCSDAICSALQLINFWQDLSIDVGRGRLYLPADLRTEHGVSEEDLMTASPATAALLQAAVHWARDLMLQGAPLVHRIPGRAGWELRLMVQGGLRIAEKTQSLGPHVLRQRPRLRLADAGLLLWRSLVM